MDISLCDFRADGTATTDDEHKKQDVGMDVLLSIGLNGIDWVPWAFPTSGSFQMSQLFASGGQSIGVSASTSVLPMNTQD